uniref:Uncharacterized protein n=1 Tax=Arundo donax TaxID=35708 RepID=A0A0A8ZNE6_ARUDO
MQWRCHDQGRMAQFVDDEHRRGQTRCWCSA